MIYLDANSERAIFFIVAGLGLVLSAALEIVPSSLVAIGIVMAIIALALSVITFALKDYSYLIDPLMHMKGPSLVLDTNEPYYISATGRCIIVRSGTLIYATSFIKIPIYRSSTEMTDEEKYNFSTVFSRAISISSNPMRMSSQLHMVNKDEYLKVITNRLNEVEDRYNTLVGDTNASKASVDRVKGEVNMWHNLLDNVTKSNSQSQVAFATLTAVGGNEDEAANLSFIASEEASAGISTALGVPASLVTGEEMLLFIEPEWLIPPATVTEFLKTDNK